MTRALLLSGYDAASHRRWREGLVANFPELDWTVKALPPRHFKWRTRGNALWWGIRETDELTSRFDLVVATSCVDLAALIGLIPALGAARRVVYFHENQFAYPTRDEFDVNLGIRDIYTALAADVCLFNSTFNRDTLLDGVDWMARKMPDFWPDEVRGVIDERAAIAPVGLEEVWFEPRRTPAVGPLQILWNHRWEYDKAPATFFAALTILHEAGVSFDLHVVGEQFRSVPDCFETARKRLANHVVTWGFVEDVEAYRDLLRSCDVVVSTAIHEFQGLAVLEAAAAGCLPVVPDRLAYRELFPDHCRFASSPDDPEREAEKLAEHLGHIAARRAEIREAPKVDVSAFEWQSVRRDYARAMGLRE